MKRQAGDPYWFEISCRQDQELFGEHVSEYTAEQTQKSVANCRETARDVCPHGYAIVGSSERQGYRATLRWRWPREDSPFAVTTYRRWLVKCFATEVSVYDRRQ